MKTRLHLWGGELDAVDCKRLKSFPLLHLIKRRKKNNETNKNTD